MGKLTLVYRVTSPELSPRYIVRDESNKLRLLESDSELINVCSRLQNYNIAAGYGSCVSRNNAKNSSIIFKPTEGNVSIESITHDIPASYWYPRTQAGMKKSDIVKEYIKKYVTNQKTMRSIGDTVFIARPKHEKDFGAVDTVIKQFINTGSLPEMGVVKDIYKSEDRSYHGSPSYETIYVIQLQNGNTVTTDSDRHDKVCMFDMETLTKN